MQTPKEIDNITSTNLGGYLNFLFLIFKLFVFELRVSSVFILASSVYNTWTLYAFVTISPIGNILNYMPF
jgi:hypothetical protein